MEGIEVEESAPHAPAANRALGNVEFYRLLRTCMCFCRKISVNTHPASKGSAPELLRTCCKTAQLLCITLKNMSDCLPWPSTKWLRKCRQEPAGLTVICPPHICVPSTAITSLFKARDNVDWRSRPHTLVQPQPYSYHVQRLQVTETFNEHAFSNKWCL
jgi:hypothetical protein